MSALAVAAPAGSYARAAGLVLAAGILWSTTGTLMRLAPHLDAWQFLTFRSFGTLCALLVSLRAQGGGSIARRMLALGAPGVVCALALTVAAVTFIFAIKATTVGNALFLNACSPLLSALLGAVILKEKLTLGIVAAMTGGLVGVVVMVAGEVEAGNLFGNVAALLSSFGFAVAGVCVRWGRGQDFSPAILSFAVICTLAAACGALAAGETLAAPLLDGLTGFASGFIFMGLGFSLFVRGAPYIPAAGQTVLAQTETVFGPLWVWLLFAETPLLTTLMGGGIVLVAVLGMALAMARRGG